jgi:hypothetical protein
MKTEYVQVEEAQYHRMMDAMAQARQILAILGTWPLEAFLKSTRADDLDGAVARAEQALWDALFPGARTPLEPPHRVGSAGK